MGKWLQTKAIFQCEKLTVQVMDRKLERSRLRLAKLNRVAAGCDCMTAEL